MRHSARVCTVSIQIRNADEATISSNHSIVFPHKNKHNNSNNNHDDIYSAAIMTEVIARVHSVHMVNVEQRQAAADPQTKLTWDVSPPVGCESVHSLCPRL